MTATPCIRTFANIPVRQHSSFWLFIFDVIKLIYRYADIRKLTQKTPDNLQVTYFLKNDDVTLQKQVEINQQI